MSSVDKTIHEFYEKLDEVQWQPFPPFGIADNYHMWYNAGTCLYVIYDVMMDTFAFIRAINMVEAYRKYMKRWSEAMNAGKWVDEDGLV